MLWFFYQTNSLVPFTIISGLDTFIAFFSCFLLLFALGNVKTKMKTKNITSLFTFNNYIDGLVQERRHSTAKALESCLSCINPSISNTQHEVEGLLKNKTPSISSSDVQAMGHFFRGSNPTDLTEISTTVPKISLTFCQILGLQTWFRKTF